MRRTNAETRNPYAYDRAPPFPHWRRRTVCLGCGYSLVGIAETAPCPECGSTLRGLPGDLRGGRGATAALVFAIVGLASEVLGLFSPALLCVPAGFTCSIVGLVLGFHALERLPRGLASAPLRTRALGAVVLSCLVAVPCCLVVIVFAVSAAFGGGLP